MSATAQRVQDQKQQEEDDYAAEECFQLVDDLSKMNINVSDIDKLKAQNIVTLSALSHATTRTLLDIKGFTEAKVAKIVEAARKLDSTGSTTFKTGLQVREQRRAVIKVTTGSKELDTILGGGIETASITEVFGEFRSGKTQLMHTLCVSSQLSKDMGGAEGRAVYMDTEGNFRDERIGQIAERFGLGVDETLENVIVSRVHNSEHQINVARAVAALCVSDGPIRVLIIDSVIAHFRTDYSGRGDLAERQQKLSRHMSDLTRLAEEMNVAVVIINQVMSDPSGMSMFNTVKPVGGHVMSHASCTRVMLKKGKGEERIAKIYDSPSMPEAEATFKISAGGICDTD